MAAVPDLPLILINTHADPDHISGKHRTPGCGEPHPHQR